MLCTLRPVSNLLSLALRLTEHLHNLAVPKSKRRTGSPTSSHLPALHLPQCQHSCTKPTKPSPKSPMQEGTYSATVCFFYLTLKVSFSFFTICLCISLFLPSSFSQSPAECALATHRRTHAHNSLLCVCLVNFVNFDLGLFFKDSISQSLWLAGFRQLHLCYLCPRQVEQKC